MVRFACCRLLVLHVLRCCSVFIGSHSLIIHKIENISIERFPSRHTYRGRFRAGSAGVRAVMTAWLCLPSRSKCRCQTHPIPTHRLNKEASLSPSPVRELKAVDRLQSTNLSAGRQVGSHLRGDRSSWVNSRIRSARRSDPTKTRREQRSSG